MAGQVGGRHYSHHGRCNVRIALDRGVDLENTFEEIRRGNLLGSADRNQADMAEHLFGDCVDESDFIYLYSGSGVGGALFLNGELYGGARGLAGELGHVKVVPDGRLCSCGSYGCLSAYVSNRSLALEIRNLGLHDVADLSDALKLAVEGNPQVLRVLERAGLILGVALANHLNTFNPPMIMLGGYLSHLESFIRPAMEEDVKRLARPFMLASTRIAFSKMTASLAYLGGIALALDGVTGLDGSHVFPEDSDHRSRS